MKPFLIAAAAVAAVCVLGCVGLVSVGLFSASRQPPNAQTPGERQPAEDDPLYRPHGDIDIAISDALSGPLGEADIIVDVDGWRRKTWKLRAAHADGDVQKYEARGEVVGHRGADLVTVNWTATVLQFSPERIRVRDVKLDLPK